MPIRKQVSRKEYCCNRCGMPIHPGEEYFHGSLKGYTSQEIKRHCLDCGMSYEDLPPSEHEQRQALYRSLQSELRSLNKKRNRAYMNSEDLKRFDDMLEAIRNKAKAQGFNPKDFSFY